MLICVKCFADLRCEKNSVLVARDQYCVQHADLYKCPECGAEVLTGAGNVIEWERAKALYNREAGTYCRLYRTDTKEIFESEAVDVG